MKTSGFTLIELGVVLIIVGVIAVVAIPRFIGRQAFDEQSFNDQTLSILRYAQKAAIAQRRLVCVAFSSNSVTLTIAATNTVSPVVITCAGNPLGGPTGVSPYSISSSKASFSPVPTAFNFDPLGRPLNTSGNALIATGVIQILNVATAINVEPETGYVH